MMAQADATYLAGRQHQQAWRRITRSYAVTLLAILLGLSVGAVIMAASGVSPLAGYQTMVLGAFGSQYAIAETLTAAVPLILIGLGLAMSFRGSVWNIGADGQFYVGALSGGAFALLFPIRAGPVLMVGALVAGAAGGAIWAWAAGYMRAKWGVNEVISSLLLGYAATILYGYFIRVPLKDSSQFLPQSKPMPIELPMVAGLHVHVGIVVAVALVPIFAYVMERTTLGLRVRVVGLNRDAARAAGIDVGGVIIWLMVCSGAMAGLAGIVQILGVQSVLQYGISPGFGFTAIIVALLGRMRSIGVLVAALFVAALTVGGQATQIVQGLPSTSATTMEAVFVLFLLAADRLAYRQ